MSENKKVVESIKWVSISKTIRIILQYVTLMILVMYLSPTDFGLMSTAMIFIGFFNLIKDFGFSAAIIQITDLSHELLSSVFWLNLIIGILFSILIFSSSSVVSNYYQISELQLLLQVLSINFLLNGVSSLPNALFEKDMNFNVLAKIEMIANLFGSFIAILLAIIGFGVWALVFQTLTVSFLILTQNWIYSSFRPSFVFKLKKIKKIYHFGINLSGFNILNYLVRNADYFLIGKFLGMNELGFYSLAYRIMLFPIQNITSVVSRVLFPALSKIKDDNFKSRELYINVNKSVAFISFPIMVGFFVINYDFVTLLFDVKWQPIINILYILVPVGMIQSIYTLGGSIFQSQNKTQLWFYWGIISAIITVSGFYIGLGWGIFGVSVSYLITNLILMYPGSKLSFNLIELKVLNYMKNIIPSFLISIVMGISIYMLTFLFSVLSTHILGLIIQIFFGILIYSILSYYFNRIVLLKIFSNMKLS